MSGNQTVVEQVDLDIDNWLGAPGADSVITPSEPTEIKPSIFTKKGTDLEFLDKSAEEEEKKDVSRETEASTEKLTDILDEDVKRDAEEKEDAKPTKNVGRPKTEKSGLVEFLKKRIESKEMFAFDDYDEKKQSLDEYLTGLSEKDIDELWQANVDNMKSEVANQAPKEFFENLPEEFQYAAQYIANGGDDLKGLFRVLAQVEEIRELNPQNENDQEAIVKQYLQATKFGTADEIEEEITTWKDINVLEKKAKQFKPKLDQMQEELVKTRLKEQELRQKQQEEAAHAYMNNVFEALRPAEINGIKLDKKVQAQLYSGLVQPNYPSISGRQTNLLGHLLEKYQYVEPNYTLIAEALWLLSDPEGYRGELKKQGKNATVENTVRTLKTEQARKNISTHEEEEETKPRRLSRPQNIFKR